MKTYTVDEMKTVLSEHAKWVRGEGGSRADLRSADLRSANLRSADLSSADLSYANLSYANLRSANLSSAKNVPAFQLPGGDLIVYKKASGHIITLSIPKDCPRTASMVGRKCRSAWAIVTETDDGKPHTGDYKSSTVYEPGKRVDADSYDPDPRVECSHGIHWFATREEAEAYT